MLKVDFIKSIIYFIFSLLLVISFFSLHTINKNVLLKSNSISFLKKEILFNKDIKEKKKNLDMIEQKQIELPKQLTKEDTKNHQLKRELKTSKKNNEKLAEILNNNSRALYALTSFGIIEQYD